VLDTPPAYTLYQRLPGLVLGFHGCDREVGEGILSGQTQHLEPSKNKYDWLGDGVYFWENDPLRAWEFAISGRTSGRKIKHPFVIGAVIDLGLCLNLTERRGLDELSKAYEFMKSTFDATGQPMPKNRGEDFGARFLDRAVVEMLHTLRKAVGTSTTDALPPYESVRGAFPEGAPLYENAGFRQKNHIQLAVRNLSCIKGYFRPLEG